LWVDIVADAAAARERGDWVATADLYAEAVGWEPDNASLRVQLGHALKESGKLDEAEIQYRIGLALRPSDADLYVQLGHLLKTLNRRGEAAASYVAALGLDPDVPGARVELLALGRRDLLPETGRGRAAEARNLSRISSGLDEALGDLSEWLTVSSFPEASWDAFRKRHPLAPPPVSNADGTVFLVVVDARSRSPAALRETLLSLIDQVGTTWSAVVRADHDLANHPVAALAATDRRIRFMQDDPNDGPVEGSQHTHVVWLDAGFCPEPQALAWLAFAMSRSEAQAVYGDHDHATTDWRLGRTYHAPWLGAAADSLDLESVAELPMMLATSRDADIRGDGMEMTTKRRFLVEAARAGLVRHIPRVLGTLIDSEVPADHRPDIGRLALTPEPFTGDIRVVIPTRDQPGLLDACISSLLAHAARPDRVKIVVMDNRSALQDTRDLFATLRQKGVEIRSVDEPFNWSRINNLAVDSADETLFVFANNDVEMLTSGWDDIVGRALSDPRVGALGTRLLYPDKTIQHAGMAFGAHGGRPHHEGVGAAADDHGPLGRWARTRAVSGVTGAFLATRRDVFNQTKGFDATGLAIAYNDVDYCLQVRECGYLVAYLDAVELIHHESKTRGHNDTVERVVWDDQELATLHARWGKALTQDPYRSPYWVSCETRVFDGYREPPLSQIVERLAPDWPSIRRRTH
jgi:O-antigen biosynthesis protein